MTTIATILFLTTLYFALRAWRLEREPVVEAFDPEDDHDADN